jgi:succinate dehydrogenase / fumarate reductase membrane anchor subunit
MYGWLFMRLSGIVLVVLVIGHLLIQLVLDGGVSKIGFAFVAGRWASPWWQVWDLAMLWLAMLHGCNGLRTVINDYAERANTRLWLKALLYTATVFTILLGTLVIFTFDPNIR